MKTKLIDQAIEFNLSKQPEQPTPELLKELRLLKKYTQLYQDKKPSPDSSRTKYLNNPDLLTPKLH